MHQTFELVFNGQNHLVHVHMTSRSLLDPNPNYFWPYPYFPCPSLPLALIGCCLLNSRTKWDSPN